MSILQSLLKNLTEDRRETDWLNRLNHENAKSEGRAEYDKNAALSSALKRMGRAGKSMARSAGKHHKKDIGGGAAIGAGIGGAVGAATHSKKDEEEGKSRWGRAAAGAGAGALAGAAAGAARTPLRQLLRMKKYKHKAPESKSAPAAEAKPSQFERMRAAIEAKKIRGEVKSQAHNKSIVSHGASGKPVFVETKVEAPVDKPKKKRIKYR